MHNTVRKLELPVETPQSHAEELRAITSLDAHSLSRLHAIASVYSRGVDRSTADDVTFGLLLFELKSARERFELWDDLTIARAAAQLKDPTGW